MPAPRRNFLPFNWRPRGTADAPDRLHEPQEQSVLSGHFVHYPSMDVTHVIIPTANLSHVRWGPMGDIDLVSSREREDGDEGEDLPDYRNFNAYKYSAEARRRAYLLLQDYMTHDQYDAFMRRGKHVAIKNAAGDHTLFINAEGEFYILKGSDETGYAEESGSISGSKYPLGDEISVFIDWFKDRTETLLNAWSCGNYSVGRSHRSDSNPFDKWDDESEEKLEQLQLSGSVVFTIQTDDFLQHILEPVPGMTYYWDLHCNSCRAETSLVIKDNDPGDLICDACGCPDIQILELRVRI